MMKRVNESIEVAAPKEDVFAYWSNFENFPEFMDNIEEIRMTGEDTSHWKVKGPLGVSVEFDARTTVMDPAPRHRLGHRGRAGDDLGAGPLRAGLRRPYPHRGNDGLRRPARRSGR